MSLSEKIKANLMIIASQCLVKKSGPNEMVLNPNCFDYHSVMHQFFHSLGFAHENQRPDYYKYITSQ